MYLLGILIRSYLPLGCLAEADEALAELRELASERTTADELEIELRLVEGRYDDVLELLHDFPDDAVDDSLMRVSRSKFAGHEIESLTHTGRAAEAADKLRSCLREGTVPLTLRGINATLAGAGSTLAEVAELLPATALRPLLRSASRAPVDLAGTLLEALWQRHPGHAEVLGFAVWLGAQLPLTQALEWSARLRQHGLPENCPLLALAANSERSTRDRVLAAALALESFGDRSAAPLLSESLAQLTAADAEPVLAELRVLAPGIAGADVH